MEIKRARDTLLEPWPVRLTQVVTNLFSTAVAPLDAARSDDRTTLRENRAVARLLPFKEGDLVQGV